MREVYAEYLQSNHRRAFRRKVICERRCCENSGSTDRLQVHHLNYARLGRERPEDVSLLCYKCHIAEHVKNATFRRCARSLSPIADTFEEIPDLCPFCLDAALDAMSLS